MMRQGIRRGKYIPQNNGEDEKAALRKPGPFLTVGRRGHRHCMRAKRSSHSRLQPLIGRQLNSLTQSFQHAAFIGLARTGDIKREVSTTGSLPLFFPVVVVIGGQHFRSTQSTGSGVGEDWIALDRTGNRREAKLLTCFDLN
jgi:hypothetical protein